MSKIWTLIIRRNEKHCYRAKMDEVMDMILWFDENGDKSINMRFCFERQLSLFQRNDDSLISNMANDQLKI